MDKEIVDDFVEESKDILTEALTLLERIETQPKLAKELQAYGNCIDRLMGGARTVAMGVSKDHALHMVADYSAICKSLGYKASQINEKDAFFKICVAVLIDGTEILQELIKNIHCSTDELKKRFPQEFINRVQLVSDHFSGNALTTVEKSNLKDSDLRRMIKKY